MKNIFLVLCLCLLSSPGFAQDSAAPNRPCIVNPKLQEHKADTTDAFFDDSVIQQYGSTASPAFLNRENINPSEDSYNFGSSDGIDSDSYEDETYEFE